MKRLYYITMVLIFTLGTHPLKAQLNPLISQYYNNPYLVNPAFAGNEEGLKLNAAYRRLWSGIPGAPLTQNITADYGFKRVGLGLNVNNESAGLLRQTRALSSYAYHLPIDSGRMGLHFGISIGMMNQRVEASDITGNPNDISIGDYNGRRTYLDGDFGIAFTTYRLKVQLAIPNLKDFLGRESANVADVTTFYSAIGYNITLNPAMELEPTIAFRGVRKYTNMIDVGAQLAFSERRFLATAMYHSNESATLGLGFDVSKKYLVSAMYTSQTSALNTYANGSFELNLRVNLRK